MRVLNFLKMTRIIYHLTVAAYYVVQLLSLSLSHSHCLSVCQSVLQIILTVICHRSRKPSIHTSLCIVCVYVCPGLRLTEPG